MVESVIVRRNVLYAAIKKNMASHRTEFLKAQAGWKKTVIEELDRRLADARAGRHVITSFNYPEPQDHTKDYERILRMVQMETRDTIEIDEHSFAQFVMDDWDWKAQWTTSNIAYITRSGKKG